MHLKRITAVAAVAAAAFLVAPAPAYAGTANWQGDVDSGGLAKIFDTQRIATGYVYNTVNHTAEAGITLVACTNLQVISSEQDMPLGTQKRFKYIPSTCFRQEIRRWTAKDTNGILPGNGVTTESGTIVW